MIWSTGGRVFAFRCLKYTAEDLRKKLAPGPPPYVRGYLLELIVNQMDSSFRWVFG